MESEGKVSREGLFFKILKKLTNTFCLCTHGVPKYLEKVIIRCIYYNMRTTLNACPANFLLCFRIHTMT
jgi:hypothetical protein